MTGEQVAWMLASGLAGVLTCAVGFWAKQQIERIGATETRVQQATDTAHAIDRGQVGDIAKLQAKVEMLEEQGREERARCADLAERVARQEAFQAWAEPLLERLVDGQNRIAAFEARFGEQVITLFKGMGAITARLEKLTLVHVTARAP